MCSQKLFLCLKRTSSLFLLLSCLFPCSRVIWGWQWVFVACIHRSFLAVWRLQTAIEAEWIYSGYFRASRYISEDHKWRQDGWGGREERKKKSNKFRGRLADIMSICHLAPRGRIKGLYEWSLLWEERAAKLLATVDFLQQSINWAGPKQAVYVPLNSECRLACRTFHQRSSSFPWLLFSVLICCIHALAMQKMQRRQMLSFCGGGDIMVLIIRLVDTVLHIKPTLAPRGCSGHRIPVVQTFYRSAPSSEGLILTRHRDLHLLQQKNIKSFHMM